MTIIYEDEYSRVIHGDCADVLPTLPMFDLLLTDPPYGINVNNTTYREQATRPGKALAHKNLHRDKCGEWDKTPPTPELLALAMSKAQHHILWGGNYFDVPPARGWLVWDKDNGSNDYADCELAYTNIDMAVRLLKYTWHGMRQQDMKNKERRLHPTQKPVPVMAWCLSFVPQARTVLDPFAGSGTTGVACKRLRRHCTLIERDLDYCRIAAKRLAEAQPMMDLDSPVPLAVTAVMDIT